MKTKIIEVESTNMDLWGKFMIGVFDEEWSHKSTIESSLRTLLHRLGWGANHVLIVDLSIGHGAIFRHPGVAEFDAQDERFGRSGIDCAYAAGFFDGEGSISVASNGGGRPLQLSVRIGQNDIRPLRWLKAIWYGGITSYQTSAGNRHFMWQMFGKRAAHFLFDIYPFLRVKQEEARLAIAFQQTKHAPGRHPYTDEELRGQALLQNEIKSLKHRGSPPLALAPEGAVAPGYFCPMFLSFLRWLYQQDISDLDALPDSVVLPELGKVIIPTAGVQNDGDEPGVGGSNPQD